MASNIVINQ